MVIGQLKRIKFMDLIAGILVHTANRSYKTIKSKLFTHYQARIQTSSHRFMEIGQIFKND